jgi:hypothetical protein
VITTEISGKTAIVTILTNKPDSNEDIEVSFEEDGEFLFIRQESDMDTNVIAITPLQADFLKKVLSLALEEKLN